MSGTERLYTTGDLADRYNCTPRAVARMARLGRWPSRKVLREYRFTDEMVQWIDQQHERWPENEPAHAPAPQQPKPQPVKQTRQRRTPQPPPLTAGNNVRRLVAKERPNRVGRTA
ncbi:helix-turn-helix domain-containing protein [Nonomuraea sp. NPDC050153]|uniref:helix-turn-helix domain-containing protein n=1 Tax=Nonomuraea sp. NPDC050153 TaxID=3364359 RepID=UPI0037B6207C